MSRKIWIALGVAVVIMVVSAGGAVAGYYWWDQNRTEQWRVRADEEYAKGEWFIARNFYGNYLQKRPRDTQALLNYADANSRIYEHRRSALEKAAVAYHQYLQVESTDLEERREVQLKLLQLYERLEGWTDLESYALICREEHPDETMFVYYYALGLHRNTKYNEAVPVYEALLARDDCPSEVYEHYPVLLSRRGTGPGNDFVEAIPSEKLNDAKVRLAVARYYRQTNQGEQARQELQAAARLAPEDPEVLAALARSLLENRRPEQAVEYAQRALAHDPKSGEAALVLAHAHAMRQDVSAAIDVLRKMDEPARVEAKLSMVFLADLLYGQNRVEEASAVVAAYQKAYPREADWRDYFEARELIARADLEQSPELMRQAVEKLDLLVQRWPHIEAGQYLLGVALLQSGDRDRAQSVLRSYARRHEDDPNVKQLLDQEFGAPLSLQEAQERVRTAKATGSEPRDWVNAAQTLLNTPGAQRPEHLEMVRGLLEDALAGDPSLGRAYELLAHVYVALGQAPAARTVLDRARDAGLPQADLRQAEAALALREDRPDRAWTQFEESLTEPGTNVNHVTQWATLFAQQGRIDLALRTFEEARKSLPREMQASLAADEVLVSAQWDTPERALARLSETPGASGAVAKLNRARLEVARRLLMESSEDREAEVRALLAQVQSSEPDHAGAIALEAQLLLRQDPPDVKRARERLEKVIQSDEYNVVALLGLSEIELRSGSASQARAHAEKAAQAAPGSVSVALQLARAYMAAGEHLQAQATLDPVLAAQPDHVEALMLYVESCIDSGRKPQDETYLARLRTAAQDRPDAAQALSAIEAKFLLARGEGDNAVQVLRRQYEGSPENYDGLRALAAALVARNQAAEAEALYADFSRRHPEESRALVGLARLQIDLGTPEKLSEASHTLTRAMLHSPEDPQAIREMIRLKARQQNVVDALSWCDRYLQVAGEDTEVLYQKALLLSALPDRLGEALETIERAMAGADRPAYRQLRGLIRVARQDYAGGLADLQQTTGGSRPTSAQVDLAMAEAHLATGRRDLAREYLDHARRKAAQEPVDPMRIQQLENQLREEGTI